jgi:hypothetical protein
LLTVFLAMICPRYHYTGYEFHLINELRPVLCVNGTGNISHFKGLIRPSFISYSQDRRVVSPLPKTM